MTCPINPAQGSWRFEYSLVRGTRSDRAEPYSNLVDRLRSTAQALGVSRLDRIVSDPAICHGQPVLRGLRYPVEFILDLLASGMSTEQILDDYADLELDDLYAALEYGARASAVSRVVRLGAA